MKFFNTRICLISVTLALATECFADSPKEAKKIEMIDKIDTFYKLYVKHREDILKAGYKEQATSAEISQWLKASSPESREKHIQMTRAQTECKDLLLEFWLKFGSPPEFADFPMASMFEKLPETITGWRKNARTPVSGDNVKHDIERNIRLIESQYAQPALLALKSQIRFVNAPTIIDLKIDTQVIVAERRPFLAKQWSKWWNDVKETAKFDPELGKYTKQNGDPYDWPEEP